MAGSESAQVPVELPLAASVPSSASAVPAATAAPRHSALVRVTHWIATLCFFALLVTGIEIVISHPRFYWGETGNVLTTPLFQLPIPSSRALVKTGYGYVLPLSSRLDCGIDRLALRNLRFFHRALAKRLAPAQGRSFLARVLCLHRQPFAFRTPERR
jgi:hypothetical protein